ncbi:hypothetical protein CTAYLR_001692 [Chrysophaeum taylorii]|uniref:SGNH hydrolase-type esterase domain-containing protein n=1 Tax=Chrysophaeum taylorii TaxID=2483200 RepID=A0AAD7XGM8_9STRA|nr:hypothetical protein CTAYLR_001692 [Chrysophaeum taylorii]
MRRRGSPRFEPLVVGIGFCGVAYLLVLGRMTTVPTRPRIVLLGDSLTQLSFGEGGWGAAVANRYQRRCDVLNRGYSGYNSRWILELVERGEIETGTLTTVFLGANDASLEAHNARQHVPLAEFEANLKAILKKTPGPAVLIAPPPVDHAQRLEYQKQRYPNSATGVLERTNESAGRYAEACERVAKERRVPCLNLWSLMQLHHDWPTFLIDGLHLSPKGNQFVATHLLDVIARRFPYLAVTPDPRTGYAGTSASISDLKPHAPWHDVIDRTNFKRAFDEAHFTSSSSSSSS